jgi:hypothetical protein
VSDDCLMTCSPCEGPVASSDEPLLLRLTPPRRFYFPSGSIEARREKKLYYNSRSLLTCAPLMPWSCCWYALVKMRSASLRPP